MENSKILLTYALKALKEANKLKKIIISKKNHNN